MTTTSEMTRDTVRAARIRTEFVTARRPSCSAACAVSLTAASMAELVDVPPRNDSLSPVTRPPSPAQRERGEVRGCLTPSPPEGERVGVRGLEHPRLDLGWDLGRDPQQRAA